MGDLVQPLAEGALDIVGDVHGEIDALRALLSHLKYRHDGREHPRGRRLVFVGDLCDRGPDSLAVVELVRTLVRDGVAQAITGNHELNALRGDYKHGNAWFTDPPHRENTEEFFCKTATAQQREEFPAFWRTLPLALEREGVDPLRIVHACWDDDAIAVLRKEAGDNVATFTTFEQRAEDDAGLAKLHESKQAALAALSKNAIFDKHFAMPSLPAVGEHGAMKQRFNPVRTVTSGLEHASEPFWAKGEWRFCERTRWWENYKHETPVVFGHYWRATSPDEDANDGVGYVFDDEYDPSVWFGCNKNLYCVDFSVGERFRKRRPGGAVTGPFSGRLAALSWPERRVTFDDGKVVLCVGAAT